jgi:acyl-CoA synthetase (AMP-forming)/AMP-acid ligase II
MSLSLLLERSARSFGDRPAVSLGADGLWTYREFRARVGRLAGALTQRLKLVPGDRVAIAMSNCPEYLDIMWAAWHAGLCAVPVNARLHPREFAYIFEHSGARVCFVTEDLVAALGSLVSEVATLERVINVESASYRALLAEDPVPPCDVDRQAPAWLFYTSGTTGRPKGATLTHHNLLSMAFRYYGDIDPLGPEDCIIHGAPLSHATGLFSVSHVAMASQNVIPASHGFNEAEIFELLDRYDNVTLFAAPTLLNRMTQHRAASGARLDRFKTIVYGGAPMYVEDLKRALGLFGFRLWQGYGQGETPNTISYLSKAQHRATDHPRYEARLASVGVPRTGVEVRVVDEADRDVPAGTIGEIIVRSDITMTGYWRNPEASAVALRGGWLHTGDLGAFDEDGFLSLRDRSKDVVISGGSNIYPREIEEVLLLHNAVAEAAIVGRPSAQWGEEVVAFVVARPGAAVTEAELDQLCLANIARFKRPKAYLFVDSLPKSNYGKILKTELREILEQQRR